MQSRARHQKTLVIFRQQLLQLLGHSSKLLQDGRFRVQRHQLNGLGEKCLVVGFVVSANGQSSPRIGIVRQIAPCHLKKPGVVPTKPRNRQARSNKDLAISLHLGVNLNGSVLACVEEQKVDRFRPADLTESHGESRTQLAVRQNPTGRFVGQHTLVDVPFDGHRLG